MPGSAQSPERQRGWVGIVVLLLALVIVEVLAQTVLKRYGLLGGFERRSQAARPGDVPRGPGGIAPAPIDATTAGPVPAEPLERRPEPARPGDVPRGPGVIAPAPIDATTAAPVPADALERARGLESAVQR